MLLLSWLAYGVLHAVYRGEPGASFVGRYLAAVLPLIILFIIITVFGQPRTNYSMLVRIVFVSGMALSGYIMTVGFMTREALWFVPMGAWTRIFPR